MFELYHSTGLAIAGAGALMLIQVLVADIAGLRVPHIPGAPIEVDHKSFLFRSARSLANMNESVVVFILFCAAGIGFGADPAWLGRCALAYTITRAAYAACYWGNFKLPRSICFGLSLVSLGGLGAVVAAGLAG